MLSHVLKSSWSTKHLNIGFRVKWISHLEIHQAWSHQMDLHWTQAYQRSQMSLLGLKQWSPPTLRIIRFMSSDVMSWNHSNALYQLETVIAWAWSNNHLTLRIISLNVIRWISTHPSSHPPSSILSASCNGKSNWFLGSSQHNGYLSWGVPEYSWSYGLF